VDGLLFTPRLSALNPPALSLDHVGAITRDLGAAGARWERLGFKLSPLSRQSGAVPGRTGMQPWASANRCAILRNIFSRDTECPEGRYIVIELEQA